MQIPCFIKNILLCSSSASDEAADSDSDDSQTERDQRPKEYMAVSCVGRQPGSDVFVLGPSIQFHRNGEPIQPDDQVYLWVPEIMIKLKSFTTSPIVSLPTSVTAENPLEKLVVKMQQILGDNYLSGLCILGKKVNK